MAIEFALPSHRHLFEPMEAPLAVAAEHSFVATALEPLSTLVFRAIASVVDGQEESEENQQISDADSMEEYTKIQHWS